MQSNSSILPTLLSRQQAAQTHARFRTEEIRVLDSNGKLERTIAFSEADRRL